MCGVARSSQSGALYISAPVCFPVTCEHHCRIPKRYSLPTRSVFIAHRTCIFAHVTADVDASPLCSSEMTSVPDSLRLRAVRDWGLASASEVGRASGRGCALFKLMYPPDGTRGRTYSQSRTGTDSSQTSSLDLIRIRMHAFIYDSIMKNQGARVDTSRRPRPP